MFVLFCWLTTPFYLYYEQHYGTRALGAFVMLVVSAAVGFLLWYTVVREAQEIQPLVPALQSWWMKLHVPANFIGYGTFSLSAMVAFAYLVKQQAGETRWYKLAPLWLLGVVLCFVPVAFRQSPMRRRCGSYWAVLLRLISALIVGGILLGAPAHRERACPSLEVLDDVMYKSIAVGFAFFTIATILGALWAAEAWGGYWSWDPKETWALIVWLNYAAWLHMRLMKGLRGTVSRLVGAGGPGGDDVRLPRRQHVPVAACTATARCRVRCGLRTSAKPSDFRRESHQRVTNHLDAMHAKCDHVDQTDNGFIHPHSERDHAARGVYEGRRDVLQADGRRRGRRGAGGMGRARGAGARCARPASWRALPAREVDGAGARDHGKAHATTRTSPRYNNFYEFGTDKADPAQNAGTLKTAAVDRCGRRRGQEAGKSTTSTSC